MVPRQFLREFLSRMDLVDEFEEYDPMAAAGFSVEKAKLTPEELAATSSGASAEDGLTPSTDVW